jgi:periplasmic protein TonB
MNFGLLESRRRRRRSPKETALSIAVHLGLIAAFVYATAESGEVGLSPAQSVQSITFAMPRAAPKAAPASPAPQRQPTSRPTTSAAVASPTPIEESSASVLSGDGVGPGDSDSPGERGAYYEHEVGVSVASLGGGMRPRYPDALRQSRVEGKVEIEFVVDERGRVDMNTVKVIESTHALFTSAVRSALRGMRFSPARVNGVAVRQFVRLPVVFQLQG